jgi:hypothetical protein
MLQVGALRFNIEDRLGRPDAGGQDMKLTILLVLAATIACASTPAIPNEGPPGMPASVTGSETVNVRLAAESEAMHAEVNADPEKVWKLLPEIYEKLGITGEVLNSDATMFGTRKFTGRSVGGMRTNEFVRCGNDVAGPSGGMYRTNLSIVTSVMGTGSGKTSLSTQIEGFATPAEGTSTEAVRCVSTGRLEKRIRTLLTERLGG